MSIVLHCESNMNSVTAKGDLKIQHTWLLIMACCVCPSVRLFIWYQTTMNTGEFLEQVNVISSCLWKVVEIRVLLNNNSFQSYRPLLMELLVYLAKTCHAGVELKHCLYMDLWCLQWRYIIYEYSGADNPLLCSNGTAKLISLA